MARPEFEVTEEHLKIIKEHSPYLKDELLASKIGCSLSTFIKLKANNEDVKSYYNLGVSESHKYAHEELKKFLQYKGTDSHERQLKFQALKLYLTSKVWKEHSKIFLDEKDIGDIKGAGDIDRVIAVLSEKVTKNKYIKDETVLDLIKVLNNVKIADKLAQQSNVFDKLTSSQREQILGWVGENDKV